MELNQDWRRLQATFFSSAFPAKSAVAPHAGSATIYCLHEHGVVMMLFSEGEDLSDWAGASLDEIRSQFPNRIVLEMDRKTVDSSLLASIAEPHLEAQIQCWRNDAQASVAVSAEAKPRGVAASKRDREFLSQHLVAQKHFLLEVLRDSWWSRVLPSSFGVFLRFETANDSLSKPSKDFLLIYRKGRLEQFGVPDLGFMGADRRKDPAEVSKYLSERFMVSVQGVLLREEDWIKWSAETNPWREIAWAVQSNRVQLVPFRWSVVSLLASRGLLGV